MSTRKMVNISLLAVLGFLLMFTIEFPLPFFPPFLKYDPSEVPGLIAAFAWGPWTGVVVELIKTILFFLSGKATSGLVGAVAAFLAGGSFAFVSGIIYEKVHTKSGALVALVAGSLAMTCVMTIANYFILLPLWGITQAEVLPLVLSAIIPFNLVKAFISSLATFVVYKRVHYWLKGQVGVKETVQEK